MNKNADNAENASRNDTKTSFIIFFVENCPILSLKLFLKGFQVGFYALLEGIS